MHRRQFVQAVWALPASLWAGAADSVRGILEHAQGDQPVLRTPSGQRVVLEGDEDSLKVLRDKRLVGRELKFWEPDSTPHVSGPDLSTRKTFW
jgi:hypothetical protein